MRIRSGKSIVFAIAITINLDCGDEGHFGSQSGQHRGSKGVETYMEKVVHDLLLLGDEQIQFVNDRDTIHLVTGSITAQRTYHNFRFLLLLSLLLPLATPPALVPFLSLLT